MADQFQIVISSSDITYDDVILVHYSTKTHLAVFYNQTLPTVSGQASNRLHVACDQ